MDCTANSISNKILNNSILRFKDLILDNSPSSLTIYYFNYYYKKIYYNKTTIIENLFRYSNNDLYIHNYINNINNLNLLDCIRQGDFLKFIINSPNFPLNNINLLTTTPNTDILCSDIGDFYIESSILGFNKNIMERTWIGLVDNEIKVLDFSFDNGILGILFYLLELYKSTNKEYYLIFSTNILRSLYLQYPNIKISEKDSFLYIINKYKHLFTNESFLSPLVDYDISYLVKLEKRFDNELYNLFVKYSTENTLSNSITNYFSLHNLGLNNGLALFALKQLYKNKTITKK
ncbi:MAG: hypothetical protein ACRC7N_00060 [Clostridium sp.]